MEYETTYGTDTVSERRETYTAGVNDSGSARRFGPRPERRFYQLDERMLWDRNLSPLQFRVLVDLFHRESKGVGVSPITDRAALFGVSYRTLDRCEEMLVQSGFLLESQRPGVQHLYLAAYPPIPPGHPDRERFEAAFSDWASSEPDASTLAKVSTPPLDKMSTPPSPKCLPPPRQNVEGSCARPSPVLNTDTNTALAREDGVACAPQQPEPPRTDPILYRGLDLADALRQYFRGVVTGGHLADLKLAIDTQLALGNSITPELLTAAVAAGRKSWFDWQKQPDKQPRGVKCFTDALADLANAGTAAAAPETPADTGKPREWPLTFIYNVTRSGAGDIINGMDPDEAYPLVALPMLRAAHWSEAEIEARLPEVRELIFSYTREQCRRIGAPIPARLQS